MITLTVTAKGRIALNEDLLRHLGVRAGDTIVVNLLPNGRIELRAPPTGRIEDVFGVLKREGQPTLSIDEINDAIARGWAGET